MNEYNIQVSLFEWNYWHKSTFWWYSNYMTSTCISCCCCQQHSLNCVRILFLLGWCPQKWMALKVGSTSKYCSRAIILFSMLYGLCPLVGFTIGQFPEPHPSTMHDDCLNSFRVRGDQGVENVDIAQCMFSVWGTGHGSFINFDVFFLTRTLRIERLGHDVWSAVTCKYNDVLHTMEEERLIDLSDEMHLFCVHYVFLPRLKSDLQCFLGSWM